MEQHVSTFLIGHHQAKHVLYNTQKEYFFLKNWDLIFRIPYFPCYIKRIG